MKRIARIVCALLVLLPVAAAAHVAQESYLTLQMRERQVDGEWVVRLADLDAALGLDADDDGQIRAEEIELRRAQIERYISEHLELRAGDETLAPLLERLLFASQNGEDYVVSRLRAPLAAPSAELVVRYTLFAGMGDAHACHVQVVWPDGRRNQALVAAADGEQRFRAADATDGSFLHYLREGVRHIWAGYDHLLFLLVLLVPAVFRRRGTGREPVPRLSSALWRVMLVVSAFTLAHSVTLSCAILNWIVLPGRLVEPAIAASVVLAALHNFLPTTTGGRGAALAFVFGLLHGFGFASVLGELGTGGGPLWRTLLGFNLGVELGQLAVVTAFVPLAFLLRHTRFYRVAVLQAGSGLAGLCAAVWFVQRAF